MTTYATLKTRIADELARSDLTSQIALAVQTAIKHYERQRFYFNQKTTGSFSTVADQEYYTSSDLADIPNIIEIDGMYFTQSSVRVPILPTSFERIEQSQSGQVSGNPEYFAYYAQKIRLYPIPDAVRTVTFAYHYKLTALSADGDTNAWVVDAEELIRQKAKRTLYLDVLRDRDGAESCAILEKEAYDGLRSETRRRFSNQKLMVDPALVSSGGYNIQTQ